MHQTPSIAGRALMAIGLMIGFYLLAGLIVTGLLFIPYAEYTYAHRVHLKLGVLCAFGALIILWSIMPRVDRFDPPGPRLNRDEQPRLFEHLDDVARATGQEMPAEVYAVGDINAWVAQRGGIMGFGSRRVMGLGLPLMQQLTVTQFRAVLAHEFGHYFGGDTRLGPWVYKTRAAIVRTVQSLSGDNGSPSLLQAPFAAYGRMFLQVTQSVSRQQEFSADALAARTIGARPLIEGLRVVHQCAPAFSAYFQHEVIPVIVAGFHPPVTEGFRRFTGTQRVATAMEEGLQAELKEGKSDPYDSHPALRERIAALEQLPMGTIPDPDPSALSLIENAAALEASLLHQQFSQAAPEGFKSVAWESAGETVYLPQWRMLVNANREILGEVTLTQLPVLSKDPAAVAQRLRTPQGQALHPDSQEGFLGYVAGAAITLLLREAGWTMVALPGNPVELRRDDLILTPFSLMADLKSGKQTESDWATLLAKAGLPEARLFSPATVPASPA